MAILAPKLCHEKSMTTNVTEVTPTEKPRAIKRRDSPDSDNSKSDTSEKNDNLRVAMYDVKNNQFRTIRKRDLEDMKTKIVELPRWSKKKKVFVPEPKDEKRQYYLATLNLAKLGFQYNLKRHLCSTRQLYILG